MPQTKGKHSLRELAALAEQGAVPRPGPEGSTGKDPRVWAVGDGSLGLRAPSSASCLKKLLFSLSPILL